MKFMYGDPSCIEPEKTPDRGPHMTTDDFREERAKYLEFHKDDEHRQRMADSFMDEAVRTRYFYNFEWMGLPIIQFPDDLVALQEIIWQTRPTVIIETGMAHGGSAAFYGSMLSMIGGPYTMRSVISIEKGVLPGVEHVVRDRLLPLRVRTIVIEGDSSSEAVLERVKEHVTPQDRVMVCLDSLHTAEHVRKEIELLAPLVTAGCYLVVFDTFVDRRSPSLYEGKTCWPGNSPMDAVRDGVPGFELDEDISRRFLISSNPNGYFKKV